jgi:dihydroflavonol-4-reductase
MFGPRDAPELGQMIVKVAGKKSGWTPGYNSVDVRDVARGMIAAWQRGKRGGYIEVTT